MKEITVRALVAAATYSVILVGLAALAGCEFTKQTDCTVETIWNCR